MTGDLSTKSFYLFQCFNEFLMEEVRFLREEISSKNRMIENLLSSSLRDNQNFSNKHDFSNQYQFHLKMVLMMRIQKRLKIAGLLTRKLMILKTM